MTDELLVPHEGEWVNVKDLPARIGLKEGETATYTLPGAVPRDIYKRYQQLLDAKYYLVRNRGETTGERWHCRECSSYHVERGIKVLDPIYHEFFTYACIRRPWKGLVEALWGYTSLTNNETLAGKLVGWAPDAGAGHPFTYGRMAPADPEAEVIAVAVGVLEDIDEDEALDLVSRINMRVRDVTKKLVL